MSNVRSFNGNTTLPLDPNRILESAKDKTVECLVIGFEDDGSLYFAGTTGEVGTVLTLMELAKKQLLEGF